MSEQSERIWRPDVRPNDCVLPLPGTSAQNHQQQVYTKTSLASSNSALVKNLNKEILSASQAYNNSPKPFLRQQQQQQEIGQTVSGDTSGKQQKPATEEENMSPKLVHNQYNSPIDLYSMNNIRKTIEAHTELIAPGLKGINFMKGDTPINKQSEVYKLVMEEEERDRQRQTAASRLSPIGPTQASAGQQAQQVNQQQWQTTSSTRVQAPAPVTQKQVERPVCCECGLGIIGPFAKLQNRFVHPQCFNCTTCGTSLKNTGYFTVNDKLYCDIHAKQVARMMHIHYDFEQQQQHASQVQKQQLGSQTVGGQNQQHQQQVNSSSAISSHLQGSLSPPATISTMFADRSQSSDFSSSANSRQQQQLRQQHNQEIKWAWRPAHYKDNLAPSGTQTNSATLSPSSSSLSSNLRATTSSSQQMGSLHTPVQFQAPTTCAAAQVEQQHQHQMTSSTSTRFMSRSYLQEVGINGRVPICTHCRVQIHGPYVLAGTTTWCKLCSQTNFNCNSCRRPLLDIGFVEDTERKYFCEHCFEAYHAPICSKCSLRIKGDCLNALGKKWHPSCFVCGHCRRPFGNSSFYLEDNVPYCERDWNILFTTKCCACSYPIEAGDKWIEALSSNYHSSCFRCTSCQANLEGSTFYCKGGKPYCRLHAR